MFEGARASIDRAVELSRSGIVAIRRALEPKRPEGSRVRNGYRSLAGVAVTPDNAIRVAAVWACLRYLSQTTAVLPWHVMLDGARGAEVQRAFHVDFLISRRPNREWSSFQFRETLTHWALRWGNGWAEIERDQAGRPYALWPIHPERCELCRDENGELFLEVSNGTGPKVQIPYRDVFHLRGFGEGVLGVNVINYAAESLGWAAAAQLFGGAFFGNGANSAGVVVNKKALTPEGKDRQREEFDQLYKGVRNAHRTAFLDNDAEWKRIGLNAEETQLIPTHQFLVEEICRWFGVPPHKVMHLLRATFSNIEHQAIEVVVDSISPWVKRWEDEADYKLFGLSNRRLYTKMNLRALMRGDAKARAEYYKMMREIGAYSVNRILELEDENTIGPDGDKHTMGQSYTTLERIGEEKAPPPTPESPSPEASLEEDEEARAARDAFEREFLAEVVDA